MILGHALNHFLDKNRLTHTGTTEESDLSTQHIRGEQVDDLDTSFEKLSLGLELVKGWWLAVDTPALNAFKLVVRVLHFADDVEHLAFSFISHGNRNGSARVSDFLATHQTIGGLQSNGTNKIVP